MGDTMKERDNIHFFDTSVLTETDGIRQRCNAEYVAAALRERLPEERFRIASVTVNETGRYQAKLHWLIRLLWTSGKIEGQIGRASCRERVWLRV